MTTFILDFWPALLAASVVGAAAPAIGAFIVQRRLSLIGDGIGHVAFAGVAIGIWLGISPLAGALIAAIGGAITIDRLRQRRPEEADIALALFFYGSIALAVVVASGTGSFNVGLFGFLFGQVLTVTPTEVIIILVVASVVLGAVALLYRGLLAIAIDEEAAVVSGVPVTALNASLMLLTAGAVAVGMQVVGILLTAALMVLPVAIGRNLAKSFRNVLVAASITGASGALAGLFAANAANTAPSGTIVIILAVAFLLSVVAQQSKLRFHKGAGT